MSYVDGFVAAVRNDNKDAYVAHARKTATVFRACGATGVVETWGDDVPEGKLTSFPMAVKCEPGETVVFSWVTWPSKAARDAGWEQVMKDPAMQEGADPMPFDGKRLIYGGFTVLLDM